MATAITVFIRISYIVNDGFPRQIFGQWFALWFLTRVADGFLFSFWIIFFNGLLGFIEQAQLILARFAAFSKLALLRQSKLFQDMMVLLREMIDLGVFLNQPGLQIQDDILQFFGVRG
jgi:hypothetical protein